MTHKEKFHENEIPKNDPKPNATTSKLVSSEENLTKNNEKLLEFQRNNDENEVPPEIDLNKLSQLDLKIIMNKLSRKSNYKCQKCTQEFANSLCLEKHTIAVHEEKRNVTDNILKCHKCGRVFSRQIFLKSHSCNVVERVKNEEKVHESENSIHVGMILIENENAIKIDTTSDDPKNDPLDIKSENALWKLSPKNDSFSFTSFLAHSILMQR